jgi:hypothetical protein
MDITSVSGASAFQQLNIGNNVATAVAAKTLNAQKQNGAEALKLLQSASPASTPAKGLDVKG